MIPENGLDEIRGQNSILLGAVGYPGEDDHVSLWGLLIPIRHKFQQNVNLRPVLLFEGMDCPLVWRGPEDIDIGILLENKEAEYSEIVERMFQGTDQEFAV